MRSNSNIGKSSRYLEETRANREAKEIFKNIQENLKTDHRYTLFKLDDNFSKRVGYDWFFGRILYTHDDYIVTTVEINIEGKNIERNEKCDKIFLNFENETLCKPMIYLIPYKAIYYPNNEYMESLREKFKIEDKDPFLRLYKGLDRIIEEEREYETEESFSEKYD